MSGQEVIGLFTSKDSKPRQRSGISQLCFAASSSRKPRIIIQVDNRLMVVIKEVGSNDDVGSHVGCKEGRNGKADETSFSTSKVKVCVKAVAPRTRPLGLAQLPCKRDRSKCRSVHLYSIKMTSILTT